MIVSKPNAKLTLDIERFLRRIEINEDCWLYQCGLNNRGYGSIGIQGKIVGAHRFAYELWIGPIEGTVDHIPPCKHKNCVNPEHLEDVSNAVNNRRKNHLHDEEMCGRGLHRRTESSLIKKADGRFRCKWCERMRSSDRNNRKN